MKKTIIIIAILAILYFYGEDLYAMLKVAVIPTSSVDDLITAAAASYNLDPNLIKAVIMQESSFESGVPGEDGLSVGLMQITLPLAQDYYGHPVTFDDIAADDININLGCWYLAKLAAEYNGDLTKMLEAYNEGPGNVDAGVDDTTYSNKVLAYYKAYGGTL